MGNETLEEAAAAFDDDALLKMMVAQFARTFPKFEGAPDAVKRARDRFVALASAAPEAREALRELRASFGQNASEERLKSFAEAGMVMSVDPRTVAKLLRALAAMEGH